MNEQNFLKQTQFFVTGDYMLKDIELPLMSALRATDGTMLATGTAPTLLDDGISYGCRLRQTAAMFEHEGRLTKDIQEKWQATEARLAAIGK